MAAYAVWSIDSLSFIKMRHAKVHIRAIGTGWKRGDDAVKAATKKSGDSRGKVIDLRKQMCVPYSPS